MDTRILTVKTGVPYEVHIGKGLISGAGDLIVKAGVSGKRAVIVTDSNVGPIYGDKVAESLKKAGIEPLIYTFPAGEASKTLDTFGSLCNFLAENQLTRSDLLVALGGGVTGDLTGFAASVYLRGIDFVQIPTTLLAQVDSSVGGKTGVDLESGKNLVGAFWQPRLVLCDLETLGSLPKKFLLDGLGECVKYGMIYSPSLFKRLSDISADSGKPSFFTDLADVAAECVDIKRQVVESDEKDTGNRMILNFGHTLGHGLERYYGYSTLTHGCGVAVGMALITAFGLRAGWVQPGVYEELRGLLEKLELPFETELDMSELAPLCLTDKKRAGDKLRLIVCPKIGTAEIKTLSLEEFHRFLGA